MIRYGGDYNPEQWPREVWDDDVVLMQRAGVNLATVAVFSWARLEPRPGEYDFGWLDEVLDGLHAGGIRVDLATATASPPPWLAKLHPETLPVTEDGVRLAVGSRQQYCPSSPVYRERARRLVQQMVDRYAAHPAVDLWHVNNEYGCHVARCYCEVSAEAFRGWLERRYGTVDELNRAWGTAFWSQRYDGFEEVEPPRAAPSFRNPTQLLDFDRFSSDELLACYRSEVEVIRAGSDLPITTNFMGFFKPVDYWAWAAEVDIVSDDTYPDPADPLSTPYAAMVRDLMRSLGAGAPWLLMEQSPSAVNWRARNAAKAPGQMRAWSYQAVARGADGILFFQWRQSAAGSEKFHSGMVPHGGTDTRVWREIEQLGGELASLSGASVGLEGGRVRTPVAIAVDWDSWWAIEQDASPTTVSYLEVLFAWHRALSALGHAVDFVRADADLSSYRVVVLPAQFVVTEAQAANLSDWADGGGTLVVGFATGVVDAELRVHLGGYLGGARLRRTLGIRVEEFTPPAGADLRAVGGGEPPPVPLAGEVLGGAATGSVWAEVVRADDAEVVAAFGGAGDRTAGGAADAAPAALPPGLPDGAPAVTRRGTGSGAAWYVATLPDEVALRALVAGIADDAGVDRPAPVATGGEVDAVRRGDVVVVINHGSEEAVLDLDGRDLLSGDAARGLVLGPQGVAVVGEVDEAVDAVE
ncbi:beta-galactosidase [Agromyces sp. LHK192]|uniref:beta-galactosidase n=1 Tax=Agromyces sp. LHK192 TaxID=2498704 RepID=UPI000FD9D4D6|nr:beta-galactosidase [Agromyces sp. LHK192]